MPKTKTETTAASKTGEKPMTTVAEQKTTAKQGILFNKMARVARYIDCPNTRYEHRIDDFYRMSL